MVEKICGQGGQAEVRTPCTCAFIIITYGTSTMCHTTAIIRVPIKQLESKSGGRRGSGFVVPQVQLTQTKTLQCLGANAKRRSKLRILCVLQPCMNHTRQQRPSGNINLRVTSSSSSVYKTRFLDTSLCCQHAGVAVTRNTAVIPTTVSLTNRFRGCISFLSKQYASTISPAA